MIRHAVIATAGHVDHGKSALVKALTGTDPDRLPEEKARGITLDLGFAHLQLPADCAGEATLDIGIVDVPGHEDFVKNMIAGVGSIDLALLVVAADDGWMPQTEEHLQILEYLGVRSAVVVITKADIGTDEALAVEDIRQKLQDSRFSHAPLVLTSSVTGRGLAELKRTIRESLQNLRPPRDIGKPRLPIDRVFTLHGVGTVVTGTLVGGKLSCGREVVIQPAGTTAHIRSLQSHSCEAASAEPGMRIALNVPDAVGIARGQIVTAPGFRAPSTTWDVALERSPRLLNPGGAFPRFRHGTLANIHFGCAAAPARIVFADAEELLPGARCLAQLRFTSPQWAFAGDRFLIRDASGRITLAGGVILDPHTRRKDFRNVRQQQFLAAASNQIENVDAQILALVERDRVVPCSQLLANSNFSDDAIQESICRLSKDRIVHRGNLLIAHSDWQKFCQLAATAIDAHHRHHPEQTGLPVSELHNAIKAALFASEVADLVTRELLQGDFAQHGNVLKRKTHQLQLPPQLRAAAAQIRVELTTRSLDAPTRTAIAPDPPRKEALRYLVQIGEAVELNHDLVLSAREFERARETVRRHLQQHASATVSDLRQVLEASRRIVVPLLERFDRDGLTRRNGDSRVLKNGR